MDTIELMRAFAAVATEGSFVRGAERMGVSNRLASKYIAQLEARLQAQLFNRTTRSVALTTVGQAYLERCRPILEQIEELEAIVRDESKELSGVIRMTAPTGYGTERLPQLILPFLQEHAQVKLELDLSNRRIALVEEGFDLAIRIGKLEDSSLVARKLSDMPFIICASPDYLARNGAPGHPSALATHDCLVDSNINNSSSWTFRRGRQNEVVRVQGTCRTNAPKALAELAIGGLGITRLPKYVVEKPLADGRLVSMFDDFEPENTGLYALYPPNRHLTARVRRLIDHLASSLKRDRAASSKSDV